MALMGIDWFYWTLPPGTLQLFSEFVRIKTKGYGKVESHNLRAMADWAGGIAWRSLLWVNRDGIGALSVQSVLHSRDSPHTPKRSALLHSGERERCNRPIDDDSTKAGALMPPRCSILSRRGRRPRALADRLPFGILRTGIPHDVATPRPPKIRARAGGDVP